jgi:hypothetical protein
MQCSHSGIRRVISPEGWRSHYALAGGAATTFAALFLLFLKKCVLKHNNPKSNQGKTSACLPDGRDETARLSGAYGLVQILRREYGRQAIAARQINLVSSKAEREREPDLKAWHALIPISVRNSRKNPL